MGKRSKWQLHGLVLGPIALVVAIIAGVLFSSAQGRGLDGLGAAIAGIMLVYGFAIHALASTIIVALVSDRSGVVIAHLAAPTAVVAVGTLMVCAP